MEKLIELLNEYEISKSHRDYEWKIEKKTKERMCGVEYTGAYVDDEEMERIVISKKYRFIQRLVENDKIEAHEIRFDNYEGTEFDKVDSTIMLLSIQDNPIEFLIGILK